MPGHRCSTRLDGYDYSRNGCYFVTVCVKGGLCIFGDIHDGVMCLNNVGRLVERAWQALPERFQNIKLDVFVVMPNHIHGIIKMGVDDEIDFPRVVGAPLVGALNKRAGTRPAPTLGDIVGAFKSMVVHEYIGNVKNANWPKFDQSVWQRNYYDRIIRNVGAYARIHEYIVTNPANWADDDENPNRTRVKGENE
ncbi:MAG: transposase [Candidatus Omnitrophota bacterium]